MSKNYTALLGFLAGILISMSVVTYAQDDEPVMGPPIPDEELPLGEETPTGEPEESPACPPCPPCTSPEDEEALRKAREAIEAAEKAEEEHFEQKKGPVPEVSGD
jgi:hypothetical protein